MTTLYKRIDSDTYYWEIATNVSNKSEIIIHWGKLGDGGETYELQVNDNLAANNAFLEIVREKLLEGYEVSELLFHSVLQFPIDEAWEVAKTLDFCVLIQDYLDEMLCRTGNGHVIASEIRARSIVIFFHAISPFIVGESFSLLLLAKKIDKQFTVGIECPDPDGKWTHQNCIIIIYPEAHTDEFLKLNGPAMQIDRLGRKMEFPVNWNNGGYWT
jgi:predicted DNA-binding WGR domain protein